MTSVAELKAVRGRIAALEVYLRIVRDYRELISKNHGPNQGEVRDTNAYITLMEGHLYHLRALDHELSNKVVAAGVREMEEHLRSARE